MTKPATPLVERLLAASHDERLSTGALYREAADALTALAEREAGYKRDAERWRMVMGMGSIRVIQYDNFDNMKYLCQNDIDAMIDRDAALQGDAK